MREVGVLKSSGVLLLAFLLLSGCGLKPGDALRGEVVYDKRCWHCHEKDTNIPSEVPGRGIGLQGFTRGGPHQDANGVQHEHTDELIRRFVLDGTKDMPPLRGHLSEQEVADLLVYVRTL